MTSLDYGTSSCVFRMKEDLGVCNLCTWSQTTKNCSKLKIDTKYVLFLVVKKNIYSLCTIYKSFLSLMKSTKFKYRKYKLK